MQPKYEKKVLIYNSSKFYYFNGSVKSKEQGDIEYLGIEETIKRPPVHSWITSVHWDIKDVIPNWTFPDFRILTMMTSVQLNLKYKNGWVLHNTSTKTIKL